MKRSQYRKARSRVQVSVGESVRIIRELQELSQNELSRLTGIPQSTISAIENDRINLGVERAKLIAARTDVLVAPVLFLGQSPYHMEFAGTMTLSSETIQPPQELSIQLRVGPEAVRAGQ